MLFYLPWYIIGASAGGILAGLFYHWLSGLFPDKHEEEKVSQHHLTSSINDEH